MNCPLGLVSQSVRYWYLYFRITYGTVPPGGTVHFVEPISIDFPYHSVYVQNLCRETEIPGTCVS
eukprot:COSAG02_NODE_36506_length_453_cov_1.661017_1_plen_65_part_10